MLLCGTPKSLPLQPHHWLSLLLWHPHCPLCAPSSSLVSHSTEVLKNQPQPHFQCTPISLSMEGLSTLWGSCYSFSSHAVSCLQQHAMFVIMTFFCLRTFLFSQIDPVTLSATSSILHCSYSLHLWGVIDLLPSHSASDNRNNEQLLCCC